MTLILAVPATDAVILASDGQITRGQVRTTTGSKIRKLNDRCVWAASGELALIQRVEERIDGLPTQESVANLRDLISQVVKQSVEELLKVDFRTQFFHQNPDQLLGLHFGDFVFVESLPGTPPRQSILHVLVNGTSEWVRGEPFASGSGDLFAYALLQKYVGSNMDGMRASVLAYKVMEEAIAVGAYGLGPPIDIWLVKGGGVQQVPDDGKALLEDAAHGLREAEVGLLLSTTNTPPP